jgi:hypothetical protein
MSIVAPYSKYKKNNFKIVAVICLVCAAWFFYDGYLSETFIEKHSDENGNPDSTLAFNQKSPPVFLAIALCCAIGLFIVKNKKIILDENSLVLPKQTINCDSIEAIDKTFFDAKGFFTITYKNQKGDENTLKISYKNYDNLTAVLDELVAKIS